MPVPEGVKMALRRSARGCQLQGCGDQLSSELCVKPAVGMISGALLLHRLGVGLGSQPEKGAGSWR